LNVIVIRPCASHGIPASGEILGSDVVACAQWAAEAILGERGTDEDEQRAHRLVPTQRFAEKRDADGDGEDGREVRDAAGDGWGAWRTMWKLSM